MVVSSPAPAICDIDAGQCEREVVHPATETSEHSVQLSFQDFSQEEPEAQGQRHRLSEHPKTRKSRLHYPSLRCPLSGTPEALGLVRVGRVLGWQSPEIRERRRRGF